MTNDLLPDEIYIRTDGYMSGTWFDKPIEASKITRKFIAADLASTPNKSAEVDLDAEALQRFKDYVHKRLDDAGIPTHPDGEHSKHGCRIGDRLDIALSGHLATGKGGDETVAHPQSDMVAVLRNVVTQHALDTMPAFTHENCVKKRGAFNDWCMANYYTIRDALLQHTEKTK